MGQGSLPEVRIESSILEFYDPSEQTLLVCEAARIRKRQSRSILEFLSFWHTRIYTKGTSAKASCSQVGHAGSAQMVQIKV